MAAKRLVCNGYGYYRQQMIFRIPFNKERVRGQAYLKICSTQSTILAKGKGITRGWAQNFWARENHFKII